MGYLPGSLRLCLLALLCIAVHCRLQPDLLTSQRFPQGQAERLIRALNLLPGVSEEAGALVDGPRLQERRIRLDVEGDAGISDEELGQYAGYFKLDRTHAAK